MQQSASTAAKAVHAKDFMIAGSVVRSKKVW
jgi:hypothetical protein